MQRAHHLWRISAPCKNIVAAGKSIALWQVGALRLGRVAVMSLVLNRISCGRLCGEASANCTRDLADVDRGNFPTGESPNRLLPYESGNARAQRGLGSEHC